MNKKAKTRKESDAIGVKRVPADAYGGIFWTRAKENFALSNRKMPFVFFQNLARIKRVAAEEHIRTKRIETKIGKAIIRAANEIIKGKKYPEFELDVMEAGAGTPLNMTMNEVLANRGLEIMGQRKGKYSLIHPNIHVNMMQSTNDVIPTTIRLTIVDFSELLEKELVQTIHETETLAKKYSKTIKTGRTHLQTAVPVTFGQELHVYSESLREALRHIREARLGLYELSLGGTAVGTGITTDPGYDVKVVHGLRKLTKQPYYPSHRKMLHTSHMSVLEHYSNSLSELADELTIWVNDWVILGSDPYAGLGEIKLPEMEPGSSIMPGKVNPSILEALKMICLQVQGNNDVVRLSAESTQLELNVMTPVLASNLFESQELLTHALHLFREKCLKKVKPTPRMGQLLGKSVSAVTALNPYLGYDVVAFFVKKSMQTGKGMSELLVGEGILTRGEANQLMEARALTKPQKLDEELYKRVQNRSSYKKIRKRIQKLAQ